MKIKLEEYVLVKKSTMEEVDFFLMMQEDVLHGEEGKEVTRVRELISLKHQIPAEKLADKCFDAGSERGEFG